MSKQNQTLRGSLSRARLLKRLLLEHFIAPLVLECGDLKATQEALARAVMKTGLERGASREALALLTGVSVRTVYRHTPVRRESEASLGKRPPIEVLYDQLDARALRQYEAPPKITALELFRRLRDQGYPVGGGLEHTERMLDLLVGMGLLERYEWSTSTRTRCEYRVLPGLPIRPEPDEGLLKEWVLRQARTMLGLLREEPLPTSAPPLESGSSPSTPVATTGPRARGSRLTSTRRSVRRPALPSKAVQP